MTRTQIATNAFCLLVVIASLGAAVWVVATGVAYDLDGLFFILVCLMLVLLFAIIPVQAFRAGLYKQLLRRKKAPAGETDPQIPQTASQNS
jgi:hypothetical protein